MSNFFSQTPKTISAAFFSSENQVQRNKGGFLHGFDFIDPETQKARGILLLDKKKNEVVSELGWRVPKHLPFASGTQFEDCSFNYPVFGRPCPTVPRHGFVDSIVCEDADSLNALSLETNSVEEGAEILVTKPVDCSYNAICTGGVITIGGGNDGATSGKSCRYFYIADDPIGKAIKIEDNKEVLLEGEVPFYEIVISKTGEVNLVQVRSAPGMPSSRNFIPNKMVVQKIVKAGGDLLEWEKTVRGIDPKTTVIDHTGGSLASHFSIHAIINGVSIFTEDCPQIGDEIEPNSDSNEITDEEREKFKKAFKIGFISTPEMIKRHPYFGLGDTSDMNSAAKSYHFMQNVLTVSLAALHNYSAIHMNKDYEMLGGILGMFARTCFGVSSGETRFKRSSANSFIDTEPEIFKWLHGLNDERHAVYTKLLQNSTSDVVNNIIPIYRIFKEMDWGGSFGGQAWVNCTKSAIDLYNACIEGQIEKAVENFNVVIHTSHNGGLYLNKIQKSERIWDDAANNAPKFAMRNLPHIAAILDDFANIKAEPSLWEDDMNLFKFIDLEPYGEKPFNGEGTPKTIIGKDAIKHATEIKASLCYASGCNLCHEFEILINGSWYRTTSEIKFSSLENKKIAGEAGSWVHLTKIPYWLGTEKVPKLFSIQKVNKVIFKKV